MSILLYFPKKQYSPRYGNEFYSISIDSYEKVVETKQHSCCANMFSPLEFIEYVIIVKQGRAEWTVKHRYNDFVQMLTELKQELDANGVAIVIPALPTKTFFSIVYNEKLVDERREKLEQILDNVLSSISRKNLMLPNSIAAFLHLQPMTS
jgi:hypothetical protein